MKFKAVSHGQKQLTHREKGTLQKSTQQLTARGTRQTTKN
jgi:hypothetical protein